MRRFFIDIHDPEEEARRLHLQIPDLTKVRLAWIDSPARIPSDIPRPSSCFPVNFRAQMVIGGGEQRAKDVFKTKQDPSGIPAWKVRISQGLAGRHAWFIPDQLDLGVVSTSISTTSRRKTEARSRMHGSSAQNQKLSSRDEVSLESVRSVPASLVTVVKSSIRLYVHRVSLL